VHALGRGDEAARLDHLPEHFDAGQGVHPHEFTLLLRSTPTRVLSRTRSRVALSAEAVTGYRDAAEKVLLPVNKPPWGLLGCSHCHVRRSEVILLRVGGARGRGALPLRLELRALLRCRIQQSVAESRVELRRFPLGVQGMAACPMRCSTRLPIHPNPCPGANRRRGPCRGSPRWQARPGGPRPAPGVAPIPRTVLTL